MKMHKVRDLAEELGVNRVTVYKWLKKHRQQLGNNAVDTPEGLVITEDGKKLLLRLQGRATRKATGQATARATGGQQHDMVEYLKRKLDEKDDFIKSMMEKQQDERQRTDSIIFTMTNQIKEQAMMIEDLRQQRQEVIVPEYYPEEMQEVQEDIMDVDKVEVAACQEIPAEVYEAPAAPVETVQEEVVVEEQGAGPVEKAEPVKKIKEKKPHQKHSWGVFKRMWVNMFQPELLRET